MVAYPRPCGAKLGEACDHARRISARDRVEECRIGAHDDAVAHGQRVGGSHHRAARVRSACGLIAEAHDRARPIESSHCLVAETPSGVHADRPRGAGCHRGPCRDRAGRFDQYDAARAAPAIAHDRPRSVEGRHRQVIGGSAVHHRRRSVPQGRGGVLVVLEGQARCRVAIGGVAIADEARGGRQVEDDDVTSARWAEHRGSRASDA